MKIYTENSFFDISSYAKHLIAPLCPKIVFLHVYFFKFQIFIVLSYDPVANVLLSFIYNRQSIELLCPKNYPI